MTNSNQSSNRLNEVIGNWFVGVAIAVLFFLALSGSVINKDQTEAKQRALYSYKTPTELRAEVVSLESTTPKGEIEPPQYYQWLARVRIAEEAVDNFNAYGDLQEPQHTELQKRLAATDRTGSEKAKMQRFNMGITSRAQQTYLFPTIEAASVPIQRLPLLPRCAWAYFESMMLMLVLMGIKARNRQYPLETELFTPTRLPIAILFWPVTAWAYPYGSPLQSLRYALRLATYVLMTFMSLGAAGAVKAQSGGSGKSGKAKAPSGWVFQSDTRWGEVVMGDGPEPQRYERLTLISPRGWMIEDVAQSNDRQWNNYFSAGKRVVKSKGWVVNLLPAFRVIHNKLNGSTDLSLAVSAQIITVRKLPKKTLGFEAITSGNIVQAERGMFGSPGSKRLTIAYTNQTFIQTRRWHLFPGWELSLSKPSQKPLGWNTGPLIEWKHKKSWPRVGIGYLQNQSGVGVIRFRLIQAFNW